MALSRADIPARPRRETAEGIYSNCDGVLNTAVVAELESNDMLCAFHAGWNFCGYVWFAGGRWHEQVWQYGEPVAQLEGDGPLDVIGQANDRFGHR